VDFERARGHGGDIGPGWPVATGMSNSARHIAAVMAAATALLLIPAAAPAATPKHASAQGGNVSAQLDWLKLGRYSYGHARLTIVRDGVTVLDSATVAPICLGGPCPRSDDAQPQGAASGQGALTVTDLDGDGEPEVIVDLYTGGAHCCSYSRVYRYDAATGTYTDTLHLWGDPGYRLEDLSGDGKPEFVSADDRFAYAFTDYAASGLPIQIVAYAGGAFTDVTRAYPALIAADAAQWLGDYRHERRRHGPKDLKGIVAAYVADEYLLGDSATGEALLRSAKRRGDLDGFGGSATKFSARLHRFLRQTGYAA
jgi:hypothetical protein